jgi:cbb3-type cytochrome oxidase maturation protein
MSIILVLIPLSILFAVAFLAAFIWAVRSGQYEDTCTPSMRLLLDDPATKTPDGNNLSNTKKPNNDEP